MAGKSSSKKPPVVIPDELKNAFMLNSEAERIFLKMPPSHQREYVGYVIEAKKPETRIKRAEKTIQFLLKQHSMTKLSSDL